MVNPELERLQNLIGEAKGPTDEDRYRVLNVRFGPFISEHASPQTFISTGPRALLVSHSRTKVIPIESFPVATGLQHGDQPLLVRLKSRAIYLSRHSDGRTHMDMALSDGSEGVSIEFYVEDSGDIVKRLSCAYDEGDRTLIGDSPETMLEILGSLQPAFEAEREKQADIFAAREQAVRSYGMTVRKKRFSRGAK